MADLRDRLDIARDIACDVAVVGAGAIGASCAFHLARQGRSVVVIEAFSGPAEGSTGRSFASVRGQWADELNIALSWTSICRYRAFEQDWGIDVGYRATGYLFLIGEQTWPEHLAAVERQRAFGVPVDVLDPVAATRITPFETHDLAGATWGSADGVVDPHLVTTAFLTLARQRGARVLFGHRVVGIEHDESADGWTLRAGEQTVRAQHVVNAAGGWAGEVAALAGCDVPVAHYRRNVYASAPGAVERRLPMTIDMATGVYLRSEGTRVLFGLSRLDEVAGYATTVDWEWMESTLEVGVDRFPWLADLPLDRGACWAGTYEISPDNVGIVGADPRYPTWVNACGFSGHGLMQAPEIGRVVSEQVCDGAITSIDASALRLDRFIDADAASIGMVF
jgi:sarcosine oxidase subunit beta